MFGQAMEIGQTRSAIPLPEDRPHAGEIAAGQRGQVRAAAKKYFNDDTLTIGVLEPQPLDGKPRRCRRHAPLKMTMKKLLTAIIAVLMLRRSPG